MMREYEERREVENIYEAARKNIKSRIEAKGVTMKGSARGTALTEILSVFDDEMGIKVAEELVTARKQIREYYRKYNELRRLEEDIADRKKVLAANDQVASVVSLLTDDVLKNAIIAYNSISEGRMNRGDAKEITIAYIKSKGREDLKDVIESEEHND